MLPGILWPVKGDETPKAPASCLIGNRFVVPWCFACFCFHAAAASAAAVAPAAAAACCSWFLAFAHVSVPIAPAVALLIASSHIVQITNVFILKNGCFLF